MCGIVGVVEPEGRVASGEVVSRMAGTLRHRGPDGEGLHLDGRVGLGHRRLSIIDLAGGAQPLFGEDGQVAVVHNGEIYNFRELRTELSALGHVFTTQTDSEVIVHAYEQWGDAAVERLDGMFAFAVWDARRRRLLLARDRFGKKPLYLARCADGTLLFASEPKAFFPHPSFTPEVDPLALADYLLYECVPAPRAMHRGVQKLRAAHRQAVDLAAGPAAPEPYWEMSYDAPSLAGHPDLGEAELTAQLWEELREAVARRLVADVPLGLFLSGGLDSSAIAAAMVETLPPRDVRTFSIAFDDPSFDESAHARAVAQHLGTRHEEERLDVAAARDVLPAVAAVLDEPLGDASVLPTYLLAKFTRRHVTVALGGDGGDELLSGYPTFYADRAARLVARVPAPLYRAARALADRLPVSRRNLSFDFKLKQFLKGARRGDDERHAVWLGSFDPAERAAVLAPDLARAVAAEAPDPFAEVRRRLEVARRHTRGREDELSAYYLQFYLGEDVLTKVDRATMAASLEARAPLLDTRFAQFAARLPARLKRRGTTTKYLLRKALEGRLPRAILARPKKGFGVPVAEWLRGPWHDLMQDLLAPAKLRREGLLDPVAVQRLVAEHLARSHDHRKPLYTLLSLELWLERFGPRAPARAAGAGAPREESRPALAAGATGRAGPA
ncbi:MAG TPA: asparagine synthase (glutamine-hydrolyzing) [Myxococcota bacterium]|jgi:asparagine synthase (glutamine-hydrolysing)|nr:asparagine synthase (glutamine-hydrolyzing) [Myxococcota bacterium]